jgi:hypothetical protein
VITLCLIQHFVSAWDAVCHGYVFYTGKPRLGAADNVTYHEVAIPVTYKRKYTLESNVCFFVVGPKTRSSSPLRRRTANLKTPIQTSKRICHNANARHCDEGCWYTATTKSHEMHSARLSQVPISERYKQELTPIHTHALFTFTSIFMYLCAGLPCCNMSPANQIIILLQTPVMA